MTTSADTAHRTHVTTELPLLSIIVPAYNVAPYVSAAIRSALDQTYPYVEVIVVNDGSTDQTLQAIKELPVARKDPRLKVINRANGGLSAARNTGIAAASGELIGFLDSDDLWLPTKAQKHVSHMVADSTIGISFSFSEYIEEDGKHTGRMSWTKKLTPTLHDMIRSNHVGNGSTPVLRRICFEKAGVFNERLRSCEDHEMWCRILEVTHLRAEAIPEPLTLYRLRGSSLSFAFESFVKNMDLATEVLRDNLHGVPNYLFRAARAEGYRIAAWKAELTNQHDAAVRLMIKSLATWPWHFLYDFHAAVTSLALFLPPKRREQLTIWYREWRRQEIPKPPASASNRRSR